jgi:hypothetical protein
VVRVGRTGCVVEAEVIDDVQEETRRDEVTDKTIGTHSTYSHLSLTLLG